MAKITVKGYEIGFNEESITISQNSTENEYGDMIELSFEQLPFFIKQIENIIESNKAKK